MIYFSLSDIGKRYEINEDSYFSELNYYNNQEIGLFIVADGMGGYSKGEYASSKATSIIKDIIKENISRLNFDKIDDEYVKSIIYNSIKIANNIIFEDSNGIAMGTTVVLALIIQEKLFVANVGDSRTYMMSEDNLVQVTKDNSYVQKLLEDGFINETEARNHKDRNRITRAVGFEEEVEVDFYIREIQKNDRLILCSDGLTTMVSDNIIKDILKENNPKHICEKLILLANENGGRDNITVTSIII